MWVWTVSRHVRVPVVLVGTLSVSLRDEGPTVGVWWRLLGSIVTAVGSVGVQVLSPDTVGVSSWVHRLGLDSLKDSGEKPDRRWTSRLVGPPDPVDSPFLGIVRVFASPGLEFRRSIQTQWGVSGV